MTFNGTREELERELDFCRRKLNDLASQLTTFQEQGRMILTDYGYFPRTRAWQESPGIQAVTRMLAAEHDAFVARLAGFAELGSFFAEIAPEPTTPGAPYWNNVWVPPLDAISLAGMVHHYRPRTYLEVGSGMSTTFVRRAIEYFDMPTRIVSIDPQPRVEINALCDETVRSRLEHVDLALFEELQAGDVLFMDNSHRSFPSSDVTVFFAEILPRLKPGVVWCLHDIFLPHDYPDEWNAQNGRYYNEQYLLLAYLLGGAACDRPLLPNAYIKGSPLLDHLAPLRAAPYLADHAFHGSCFWMTRVAAFGATS